MWNWSKMVCQKYSFILCISPLRPSFDDINSCSEVVEQSESSGLDRLKMMFSTKQGLSVELNSCIHGGLWGLVLGGFYGGFVRSRLAYLEFFQNNQATAFRHHLEAKKALQNHVTVNFAKGAFSWGLRLGMFTGSFVFVSTACSVYRGKSGIMEYSIGGCVSGSLFRSNLGYRGMLVGGLLGTVLGTTCGALIVACLKVSGVTMEDVRNLQYQMHEHRLRARSMVGQKILVDGSEEEELIKEHDEKFTQSSDILPESQN